MSPIYSSVPLIPGAWLKFAATYQLIFGVFVSQTDFSLRAPRIFQRFSGHEKATKEPTEQEKPMQTIEKCGCIVKASDPLL